MARRLGLLGPLIVALGVVVAAVGVWFMISARPTPGAVIERIELGEGDTLSVRAEDGGERAFVELHRGGEVAWQALVPRYGGRPGASGIAWTRDVVSVRVVRGDRAEVFAISRRDASKLGGIHLVPDRGPIRIDARGPVTLTDHKRSYELVAGDGWAQLIGVDLKLGTIIWRVDLGPEEVTAGGIQGGLVWLEQGGARRWFSVLDGNQDRSAGAAANIP